MTRAKHSGRLKTALLGLVAVGLIGAGALLFVFYGTIPRPMADQPRRVLYEVPESTSAQALITDLDAKGLIDFPAALRLVLRFTGWEKRIRAGFYYLPPRNSAVGIARLLTSGQMASRTLTIPEGKTSWEVFAIARRAFPDDSLDAETFEALVHDSAFARSLGVPANSLEGYLYPDTYEVPFRMKERDVLRLLVARFHEVVAELETDGAWIVERHGVHGWVTLASIVEKEAAVRREQRRIAGVFTNRLRQGWSLGADPTVRFALRRLTGSLRKADLNIDSPYNTRRFRGLPPGPVCSPGASALKASLHPEKTRMMFFVAKDDGSREHYFSVTYAEHNLFKAQAALNREQLRIALKEKADSLVSESETPLDSGDALLAASENAPPGEAKAEVRSEVKADGKAAKEGPKDAAKDPAREVAKKDKVVETRAGKTPSRDPKLVERP